MEKRMEKTDYKITEFHNSEFGSIRMIEDGGRLLFSGIDVAFALGYAKPRNAINVHCKGALKRGVLTSGGVQPMIFIPEGDVYRLITKSRLKSAQNFEKWVFDEVLPAIRKTGGYLETDLLDRVKDNPELLLEFAERLLAENNRNRELQNRVKDMQPKADYYDHFMITGECTNIRTTAKEIEFPERKFVKLLLNRGFLYRSPSGTLLPYAVEKNNDLFIVKDYFNNGHLGSQTLVTPKGKEFFNKEFWKYALGFNIPLLAYYLSQVVFNQSDRIMISHITSTSDAAMYGVAYNLAMILTFVLNAINGSYVPWLYGKIKKNNAQDNKSISLILIMLMGLIILCVIWYAPEIILIMAGKQYSVAIYVVAPVSMSLLLLFYSQLFINIEFYYEEKKMLVYGSIGAAVLNIILNGLLIPIFGFVAAGYTTLISYIVFALSNYYTMRLMLKKRKLDDDMYDYKLLLLLFVAFMISGFLGVALYGNLILRILITLVVFGLLVINKNKFIDALKKIKER